MSRNSLLCPCHCGLAALDLGLPIRRRPHRGAKEPEWNPWPGPSLREMPGSGQQGRAGQHHGTIAKRNGQAACSDHSAASTEGRPGRPGGKEGRGAEGAPPGGAPPQVPLRGQQASGPAHRKARVPWVPQAAVLHRGPGSALCTLFLLTGAPSFTANALSGSRPCTPLPTLAKSKSIQAASVSSSGESELTQSKASSESGGFLIPTLHLFWCWASALSYIPSPFSSF